MELKTEKIVGAEIWGVVKLLTSKIEGGLAHPRWAALRIPQVRHRTVGSPSGGASVVDGMAAVMASGPCVFLEAVRFLGVIRVRGVVGCI